MKFLAIRSYDNYIPAHLALGRLKEDGIQGWLKDENNTFANAVGAITLMVPASEAEKATSILNTLEKSHSDSMACPWCHSKNIQLVSSPRKSSNWFKAISAFFLTNLSLAAEKEYHCFNCDKEFLKPISIEPLEKDGSGFSS